LKKLSKKNESITLKVIISYHVSDSSVGLIKVLNKQLQQYQAIFITLRKKKKKCATVNLNLAKAFDTIDHKL